MTSREPSGSTPDPTLPREAYTLLAQANLLRMRGRWDEAVDRCMAALRLAPQNASAQSLLGDIYENQGRLDDAIQWYRMALDINPDSPADTLKLERLLEAKQHVLTVVHPHSDFTPLAPITIAQPQPTMPPVTGPRIPDHLLRWGAWLLAVLAVLVVVLTGLAMAGGHKGGQTQVMAPTVVLPTQSAGDPVQTDPSPAADPSEQALLQALQHDASLTAQNVSPVAVQIDPRQSTVTLTLLCPPPAAGVPIREALLRDSLLALVAAGRFQSDRVPAWTVRCLLQGTTPDAAPTLAFVADTSPAALTPLGPAPSAGTVIQMTAAFHNLWWSPTVPAV